MLDEYDSVMFDSTLTAIDRIIQVYDSNKKVLDDIQVQKTVKQVRGVLKDITVVNTIDAKNSLCRLLDDMLADVLVRVSELEKFIELSSKEINSLNGKIPMPKWKVRKIMKSFGFHDYAVSETNEGNLADIDYKNREDDQLNEIYEQCKKADIKDDDSSIDETEESVIDEQMEKLYDEISGNELNDPDVKEEDIKEITPEQFMNVLDDTKHIIDEARKNAEESKKISKKEDKSFKSKKRHKRNK